MNKRKFRLTMTTGQAALEMRRRLGMSQPEFWGRVGVSQSGGSRYEVGETREISLPVQILLNLVYGTDEEARRVFEGLRGKEK